MFSWVLQWYLPGSFQLQLPWRFFVACWLLAGYFLQPLSLWQLTISSESAFIHSVSQGGRWNSKQLLCGCSWFRSTPGSSLSYHALGGRAFNSQGSAFPLSSTACSQSSSSFSCHSHTSKLKDNRIFLLNNSLEALSYLDQVRGGITLLSHKSRNARLRHSFPQSNFSFSFVYLQGGLWPMISKSGSYNFKSWTLNK